MPTTRIRTLGEAARTRSMIAWMFARRESTERPRRPSFAPVSSTNTSTGCRTSQSIRRRAPAEVSPLYPALSTRYGRPSESIRCAMSAGYASSGSRPSPAVRLVPTKSKRLGAEGIESIDVESSARDMELFSPPPHAPRSSRAAVTFTKSCMLEARGLTKSYESGAQMLTVLRDVNFTIRDGEFVAIIGPSGSGKTTLLGLLAGLDVPSAGTVILDGADLAALGEDARARLRGEKVGFVFQSFQLIPTLTALENVQVPLELRGDRNASVRARDLLARVGLAERTHHYPVQLSGGEQQRVAIARAFSNLPKVLFADEPTGNLDASTGGRIVELLESLNREDGTTLILVTHDPAIAGRARRVVRLADGAVISDAEAA